MKVRKKKRKKGQGQEIMTSLMSFPNFPTLPRFYEYPQISLVRNHSDSSTEEITTTSEAAGGYEVL